MGLNAGFEILSTMSLHIEAYWLTVKFSKHLGMIHVSVLQYGNVALRQCATFIRCQK